MRHWSCALCSFQVEAHTQSTRTKKDASRHERHDIYTTVFFLFFLRLTTFLTNDREQETPRYDVVAHHWFHDWRSSMPTELGCDWQETTVPGYWFSCQPKADPQVPLKIEHFIVMHFRGLTILFEHLKEIQISEIIWALSLWSASAALSSAEATFKNSKLNPPCILGALPKCQR